MRVIFLTYKGPTCLDCVEWRGNTQSMSSGASCIVLCDYYLIIRAVISHVFWHTNINIHKRRINGSLQEGVPQYTSLICDRQDVVVLLFSG